jgi:hypothetical protein
MPAHRHRRRTPPATLCVALRAGRRMCGLRDLCGLLFKTFSLIRNANSGLVCAGIKNLNRRPRSPRRGYWVRFAKHILSYACTPPQAAYSPHVVSLRDLCGLLFKTFSLIRNANSGLVCDGIKNLNRSPRSPRRGYWARFAEHLL